MKIEEALGWCDSRSGSAAVTDTFLFMGVRWDSSWFWWPEISKDYGALAAASLLSRRVGVEEECRAGDDSAWVPGGVEGWMEDIPFLCTASKQQHRILPFVLNSVGKGGGLGALSLSFSSSRKASLQQWLGQAVSTGPQTVWCATKGCLIGFCLFW